MMHQKGDCLCKAFPLLFQGCLGSLVDILHLNEMASQDTCQQRSRETSQFAGKDAGSLIKDARLHNQMFV